ncbi:MAG: YhbD family protein [Methanomassiliicoccaceae archaeon]|nr:YhbD family protein [Methanomassiliicoccaceae archaeon]
MDEDLISKKELLELKEISYGTLYRWKRKGLIPDDWFIRRSTYTGQETFFPRGLILERVDSILNSKEGTSLDDLAKILSGTPLEMNITLDEMEERGMISASVKKAAEPFFSGPTDFDGALIVHSVGRAIEKGDLSLDDAGTMIRNAVAAEDREALRQGSIVIYRKQGVAFCAVLYDPSKVLMDTASKLVIEMNMPQAAAAFKAILSSEGEVKNE